MIKSCPPINPNPAWAQPLVARLSAGFVPELLKKEFIGGDTPSAGHCYVASEALYHALGGRSSGFRPMNVRVEGVSHWFLKSSRGEVIDPTWSQFKKNAPYGQAVGRGFLTSKPSARAQAMMALTGLEEGCLTGYSELMNKPVRSPRVNLNPR